LLVLLPITGSLKPLINLRTKNQRISHQIFSGKLWSPQKLLTSGPCES
jgi:hypothetical protein